MTERKHGIDVMWDDNPVDITQEANFIWSIANKLRSVYMPDKYGDVVIPMTIIRRLECALEPTKEAVVKKYKENPQYPSKAFCSKIAKLPFYNTSEFSLRELCNDAEHIEENFKSYINGFSDNVKTLLLNEECLNMGSHIKTMNKGGCLYNVVKAFSELDLSPLTYDSIKMGYIFENLIGRAFQNVGAGQFYTGRDIIKLCVSILLSEGCDDIFDDQKIITVCDQACGTGGMLSTAFSYIRHFNPTADVQLFGQEYNGVSYAVGLAEMLIKGQNADNFRHADTFKEDCFSNQKMRFVLENPPFGTPWAGKDAKDGQEKAVREEFGKDKKVSRWGAGLPGGGDSQLLFVQSAVAKLAENGRAAIIEDSSPLCSGSTASGESQIRRWLLQEDLLEAIIQLPTDLFYNTGIATYIWVLSKNKSPKRRGKVQLINASEIYHKLRKALGDKKKEFSAEDRAAITKLYTDFEENALCKIFRKEDFIYREYTVMQPLQRSYSITDKSIERMLQKGTLKTLWDDEKVAELEGLGTTISGKEKSKLEKFYSNKVIYDTIITSLNLFKSEKKWLFVDEFLQHLDMVLIDKGIDKKLKIKLADGLSVMDKESVIQKDKKGNVIYDKETKDTEIVKFEENIDDYMAREVLPHIPDAKAFFEEDAYAKKPVIKTGAEIPFTRYFYKYQPPRASNEILSEIKELDISINSRIAKLLK